MKGVRRAESVESGEKERSAAACARRKLWAHCKLLPLPLLAVSAALRSGIVVIVAYAFVSYFGKSFLGH